MLVDVYKYLKESTSLRDAWRKCKEDGVPVAWDTFRKQANKHLELYPQDFGGEDVKESPKSEYPKVGLALYDLHIPFEDDTVLELAKNYVKEQLGSSQLSYLILGGDVVTCDSVSRWTKDPKTTMPLDEELLYAKDVLAMLLDDFNPKETFYIAGNHEQRLQNYLWTRAPEVSGLRGMTIQDQLELDNMGIQWIDNLERRENGKRFFYIGQLNLLHGHELGITPQVAPARRYLLRTFAPTMMGHVHRVDECFERTVEDKVLGSWVCGCSCRVNLSYRPHNNWTQGFAIIKWYEDGLFEVQLKKVIGGRVL